MATTTENLPSIVPQMDGAELLPGGQARFRVWAPAAREMTLRLLRRGGEPRDLRMERDAEGFHSLMTDALAGDRYFYVPDGSLQVPDPVSRLLPEGVHGPTEIVDPAFAWSDQTWRGRELRDFVIYEMHVGTFTPEGTFAAAISRLDHLKRLGVSVIEVMPVAAFPGTRNWGYDGVSPYSVHVAYGGPAALKEFVNAAHAAGLAVILDVVYNHLGNEGNYLRMFGPYFTDRHKTPWGDAINFDGPDAAHVRRYFVANACYWVREYHLDGLRLDAVQTIQDDSPRHILREIGDAVHALGRELGRTVVVTAETDENQPKFVRHEEGGYALDAVWSDDFHHVMHALLTGERAGYYQDFIADAGGKLARALEEGFVFQGEHFAFWGAPRGAPVGDMPLPAHVICTQNHDQVGNRAKGERLTALVPRGARKAAAAVLLLAPHTPLLFMGQEYDEPNPFQYFTNYSDRELARATSEGRRREFKDFPWEEVPDPEDPQTFARSKLAPQENDMFALYRDLLRLRREFVIPGERTCRAEFSKGVLTMQVPAREPKVIVQAALKREAPMPAPPNGWKLAAAADEDRFGVQVWTLN